MARHDNGVICGDLMTCIFAHLYYSKNKKVIVKLHSLPGRNVPVTMNDEEVHENGDHMKIVYQSQPQQP